MKKRALILVLVAATRVSALAQGEVVFNNIGGRLVKWGPGTPKAGQNVMAADGILVQLLWLNPNTGEFEPLGAPTRTWPVPTGGVFNGGIRRVPMANVIPPGWTFGVVAWEAAYGTDWPRDYSAAVMNGGFVQAPVNGNPGTPVLFQSTTSDYRYGPPPVVLAALIPEFVMAIPEPPMIELGIAGVGALLLLRRRGKV